MLNGIILFLLNLFRKVMQKYVNFAIKLNLWIYTENGQENGEFKVRISLHKCINKTDKFSLIF